MMGGGLSLQSGRPYREESSRLAPKNQPLSNHPIIIIKRSTLPTGLGLCCNEAKHHLVSLRVQLSSKHQRVCSSPSTLERYETPCLHMARVGGGGLLVRRAVARKPLSIHNPHANNAARISRTLFMTTTQQPRCQIINRTIVRVLQF